MLKLIEWKEILSHIFSIVILIISAINGEPVPAALATINAGLMAQQARALRCEKTQRYSKDFSNSQDEEE